MVRVGYGARPGGRTLCLSSATVSGAGQKTETQPVFGALSRPALNRPELPSR